MKLVVPSLEYLPSYKDALERGWSYNEMRPEARLEELEKIDENAADFLAAKTDLEAKGPPFTLPDGSKIPRIPGYVQWMWDGEFCGDIGFRWQPGTVELPPHVLGHIGYGVVPWKRGRGYAKAALAFMLVNAKAVGLPYVEITTDLENRPSQRVIEANGGVSVGAFTKGPEYGSTPSLRYRISL